MIDFYCWQTSNAQRVSIMLEACGLPYRVRLVDLSKGEQRRPEYLAINPAGAVPAIVDDDGPGGRRVTLSQSGAIMLYLADKAGRFVPADAIARALVHQWLMFALTDVAAASTGIFLDTAYMPQKSPENAAFLAKRLVNYLKVADGRLADREHLTGELSIADMALYPIVSARKAIVDAEEGLANLRRWHAALGEQDAFRKGMQATKPA